MNKKGFTLVELLAVIVILSIIAVITIPMIKGVIEKSKLGAIKDSVVGIEESIRLYFTSNEVKDNITFTINEGQISSEDTSKMLTYKGKIDNGSIKIYNDGLYAICIEQDGFYALKNIKDKKVTAGEGTCEFNEETNEYEGKTIGSSIRIFVNGIKTISYPSGQYNVEISCDGASAKWNNIDKGVTISDITKDVFHCDVNFVDCSDAVCDTTDFLWTSWVKLLGKDPNYYDNLEDFLVKEMTISSCSDIEKLYENNNGAYDYLKDHKSLISEINSLVDYKICSKEFTYKGSVEEYQIPFDGVYKLEVWGAQGGSPTSSLLGGMGGYSIGFKQFNKNDNIYVVVGQVGGVNSLANLNSSSNSRTSYNGGGSGNGYHSSGDDHYAGGGGGATHMASTNRGVLSSYKNYTSEIYLVAGGGGGGTYSNKSGCNNGNGGAGGGFTGSSAGASGATQTSGYSFGQGGSAAAADGAKGGGGGGYYGGYASGGKGGGGGSGYIGGVPIFTLNGETYPPSTESGKNSGNGKAKITFVGIK